MLDSIRSKFEPFEHFLNNWTSRKLPNYAELQKRFNLSRQGLKTLLSHFESLGKIQVQAKSGVYLTDTFTSSIGSVEGKENQLQHLSEFDKSQKDKDPFSRIYSKIEEQLLSNVYKRGTPIPKIDWLRKEHNTSPNLILKVLLQLENNSLIYKNGKRYFAGKSEWKQSFSLQPNNAEPKAIFIIQFRQGLWESTSRSLRTFGFFHSLSEEMNHNNCYFYPTALTVKKDAAHDIPIGLDAIKDVALSLKHKTLGFMVLMQDITFASSLKAEIFECIKFISQFQKKMIWLDLSALADGIPVKGPNTQFFNQIRSLNSSIKKNLIRIAPSELNAGKLSYQLTQISNEQKICIVSLLPTEAWVVRRIELFCQQYLNDLSAQKESRKIRLLFKTVSKNFSYCELHDHEDLKSLYSSILPKKESPLPNINVSLKKAKSVFSEMLSKHFNVINNSLIISLQDEQAKIIYSTLYQKRFKCPKDFRILSYDAQENILFPFPISSISFGFSALGYKAFHLLNGSIIAPRILRNTLDASAHLNHGRTIYSI